MSTFNVSSLTSYKNQLGPVFTPAVMPKSIVSAGITVKTGVKGTESLNILNDVFYTQAGGCATFTNSGLTTFTQRDITVTSLKIEKSWCLQEIETYWQGQKMAAGSTYNDLDFLQTSLVNLVEGKVAETNEKSLWQGVTSGSNTDPNLNLFNGWIKVLSGETSRVSATTINLTGITSSNIITAINEMITKLPAEISGRELTLFMSPTTFNKFVLGWVSTYSYQPFVTNEEKVYPLFPNIKISVQPGLLNSAKDYLLLTYAENLVLGTDLESENDTVSVWYSQDYNDVRARVQYKLGCQVVFPSYCVVNY